MPRKARIFSHSGYLHVIMRGIGKQILLFHTLIGNQEAYDLFLNAANDDECLEIEYSSDRTPDRN